LSYADAYTQAQKGRPLLVMVSTEWCPACQVMKRRIMPQVRLLPLFGRVIYASVNPDQEADLSHALIGNGPIPQLILFRRQSGQWSRTVLVGSQTVEAVAGMIETGTLLEPKEK
jgi:thioredoxin-like negative regulator of GroEL